ncbi:MAG: dipeptidase [Chloroflexi bacterium]|nr:dipeptidase [Chloroflexota bacterium]
MTSPNQELLARARALHDKVPLIDGHNDLPWQYRERVGRAISQIDISQPQPDLHTDLARLKEGGLGGQFWSVYVSTSSPPEEYVRATMEQIDVVHNLVRRYPDAFQLALTADDVENAFEGGKIASLIGMEGGHSIDNSLASLRMFFDLGARYMTLTHNKNIDWADSCTDEPKANGLTDFGREVVREMNRLGMLVDLSHVSPDVMRDALDTSEAPIVFSHSSARALCDHPRNVPDDVLRRVPSNGGVVMVSFVPGFTSQEVADNVTRRETEQERLKAKPGSSDETIEAGLKSWDAENPAPRATLSQVADHIDHMRETAGIDHIGIGSDFDGIKTVPIGLEDVSTYPALTAELLRREYSEDDILKILGRNVLRVMRDVEGVAGRLQVERRPSEALIEDVDGPS